MLCTDKGSMVQAQLLFWMDWVMTWHACSIPLFWDDQTRVVRVYYPLQEFIIDWLLMFVNQTQVGADLRYFCCNASQMSSYTYPIIPPDAAIFSRGQCIQSDKLNLNVKLYLHKNSIWCCLSSADSSAFSVTKCIFVQVKSWI